MKRLLDTVVSAPRRRLLCDNESGIGPAGFRNSPSEVFYCRWRPYADLRTFYRYLQPGGVLMMRLAKKRFILGAIRRLVGKGSARDEELSHHLQNQSHSISVPSLARVLRQIGFSSVQTAPRAITAPAAEHSWQGRAWYLAASSTQEEANRRNMMFSLTHTVRVKRSSPCRSESRSLPTKCRTSRVASLLGCGKRIKDNVQP